MMNYIFSGMILSAVCFGIFSGNTAALTQGILTGAEEAVSLLITMAGMLMLWSGIMEIAQRSGFTRILGRLLSPVLKLLFKDAGKDEEALSLISMNVSANLLGLGNAATPFGLAAMERLDKINNHSQTASSDMVVFVVMNTASIQLFPTMVGTLRQSFGCKTPFDILPAVWLSSACALTVGLVMAKAFSSNR